MSSEFRQTLQSAGWRPWWRVLLAAVLLVGPWGPIVFAFEAADRTSEPWPGFVILGGLGLLAVGLVMLTGIPQKRAMRPLPPHMTTLEPRPEYSQWVAYYLEGKGPHEAVTAAMVSLLNRAHLMWPICAWTDERERPHVLAIEEQRLIHARLEQGRALASAYRLTDVRSVSVLEMSDPGSSDSQPRVLRWRIELVDGNAIEPWAASTADGNNNTRSVMMLLQRPAPLPPTAAPPPGTTGYVGFTFEVGG